MGNTTTHFDRELEDLLAEGTDGAQRREDAVTGALGDPAAMGIVLFGAGNLGRHTLSRLRKLGIEPFCFIDNNQSLWGEELDGLPVLSPIEGAKHHGKQAMFVVTIWRGESQDRMGGRIEHLRGLGCETVVPFLSLYWKYADALLPHYMHDLPHRAHAQADRIRQAFRLLADDASRREYIAQLRFRLRGDFACLSDPVPGEVYFRDELFHLTADETLVDCGAFDGDTLARFLGKTRHSFKSAIAFEPDPANYLKLAERVNSMPPEIRRRIVTYETATGETNGRVSMDIGKGVASKIGDGDCEVECVSLDSVLAETPVSMIKMDIEGSETDTLAGARELIRKNAPILTVCAYHRQSDLWNIPLLIHTIRPDYLFHLRPHLLEGWDLVCYAVPPHRRRVPGEAAFKCS